MWNTTGKFVLTKDYVLNGWYSDINRDWYIYVGFAFITLIITNQVISLGFAYIWQGYRWLMKMLCRAWKVLQVDLNKLYEGYDFNLQERYATNLSFIFVCMIYCGPIPLLIPILAIYFIVWFWTDKFILIYFSKKPPSYNISMHVLTMTIMPFAMFLHLCFSIWAYGAPDVFPQDVYSVTDSNTGNTHYFYWNNGFVDRITSSLGLPFFILLILAIILYVTESIVLRIFFKFFFKSYGQVRIE